MADEIVIWPHKVLTTPTREVASFDAELHALLDRMRAAMIEAKGIGIAANQISVPLRVAIVGRGDGSGTFVEMVNPRITARRGEKVWPEGCLSVPGEEEQVVRFDEVDVTWLDRDGKPHSETAKAKFAHVVQHEVDHLDGVVYVMHISSMKRDIIRRKMLRMQKASK